MNYINMDLQTQRKGLRIKSGISLQPMPFTASEPSWDALAAKIVRLAGSLALETVHDFLSEMRFEASRMLVIEMSQVTFLDSAGVGALVALFVSRRNNDRKLALVSLSARSVAAPQLSGLIELLPVYASAEAATRELVCV